MRRELGDRLRHTISLALSATVAIAGAAVAGAVAVRLFAPSLRSHYVLWISGRALGIGSFLSLTALVYLGTWMRHPWRLRLRSMHAEVRLRSHAALAIATVIMVAGHLATLASDAYAGVGWWGALIPGLSHFRTIAVALGVISFWFIVLLTLSAGLAGRRGTRHWISLHHVATVTFAMVWFHGLLSGTDAWRLRLLYLVAGGIWVLLSVTRFTARSPLERPTTSEASTAPLRMPELRSIQGGQATVLEVDHGAVG